MRFAKLIAAAAVAWPFTSLISASTATAEEVKTVDFSLLTYMRAGTGVNTKGGKQACFNNVGSVGNEFRLGNECSIYGETGLRGNILKSKGEDSPFFYSQFTVAYNPGGDSQYEDFNADHNDLNVIEAYLIGGNFDGIKMNYWAGKRFYRTVDVHMNDFYYFENMNGTGGGVGDINLGIGKFSAAILRESVLVQTNGLPPLLDRSQVDSTVGVMGKTALDLRLDGVKLSNQDALYFWGVAAYTPPGFATINGTGTTFEAGRGFAYGVRHRHTIGTEGSLNDFAVVYGTGVMQSLEMSGAAATAGKGANDASRLRFVEHYVQHWNSRLDTAFAATYESRNSGASTDNKSTWWNVGIRPVYFFTEHFHLLAEVGHSEVRDDADRSTTNARIGARQLNRVTLAPEVGLTSGIFGRPVIRFFVTQSFWNDDNRAFLVSNVPTFASSSPLGFGNESQGTSIGVQSEVWF